MVAVGQQFEGPCLGLWRLLLGISRSGSFIGASLELKNSLPRWLTHMAGQLILAGCFPRWACHRAVLMRWQMTFLRFKPPKWTLQCLLCLTCGSHTPSFQLYSVGPVDQSWFSMGGNYTRTWGKDHCGLSCEGRLPERITVSIWHGIALRCIVSIYGRVLCKPLKQHINVL